MKPIIGLTPLWDYKLNSLWMHPAYLDAVADAGAIPVVLPFTDSYEDVCETVARLDGILFTGGEDVDPVLYNDETRFENVVIHEMRDKLEMMYARYVKENDIPTLGICRGAQVLNIAFGGNMYQDIPSEIKSDLLHDQKEPYDEPIHSATVIKGTPLYELVGKDRIEINSLHHQSVKDISKDFVLMAKADDDVVEAIYMPEKKFVWGIQWHPELMYKKSEDSRKIIENFIKQTK